MRSYESLSSLPPLPGPVHLAIGMFDGVHLGHQAIIAGAVHAAAAASGTAAVLTFAPHPGRVLHPEAPVQLIYDAATKAALIAARGVACLICEPFTPALAALGAAEFIALLRRAIPNLAGIHVGDNFRFGRGRSADAAALAAPGLRVFITPCVGDATGRVSSSRIRELLAQGEPAAANALLGHAYTSTGRITPGRALGRQLGFPTLNLDWQPELSPRHGVYVVRACRDDGPGVSPQWFPGVANYGLRPTVEATGIVPRIETHLFADAAAVAAAGLDAGSPVRVEWLHFLRPEKKFSSLEALLAQIRLDTAEALKWGK